MLRWTSLFTDLVAKNSRQKRRTKLAPPRRLVIDALEDRRMLSAVTLGAGNEPFVVVDPFNPLNVVVGANDLGAVFSTDGAETFSAASLPTGFMGDPGLAIDSAGNVFFSYLIEDSIDPTSFDIAVSETTFADQDFTANQIVVSNGDEFDNKELIVADHFTTSPFRDNVYVAWREISPEGLRYSHSTDGGTTFSPSQVLALPANVFTSGADPEVGPSGEVYIMYWDGSNIGGDVGEIRLLKSTDGGVTFANPISGGGGISAAPGVVGLDATGLDHDLVAVRNQAPNQSFRWPVRTMIDVEADPLRSGNVYAVWLTDPDGTTAGDAANVLFSRSVDGGVNWSFPTVLNDDGGSLTQHMPTIAVDEAGNLVSIWYDERLSPDVNDPNLSIFGSVSLDGGVTWSPNFLLEDSTFDPDSGGPNTFIGDYIKVAAADGTAFATWTQTDAGGTNEILFEKFSILAAYADRFEPNNTQANATVLGSVPEITLRDLTIHDEDDEDWFKITANSTGSLVVNAFFDDAIGDIDIRIWDENSNVISSSISSDDDEQIVIPVVSQESYFLEVDGFGNDKNHYDLEIENFAAPVPQVPVLHPDDDNGISDEDNITDVTDPNVVVQADLAGFDQMGILILSAAEAAAGETAGAAVEVFINGESQGFADPVGSSHTLFDFELSSLVLQNGLPITGGTLNFVTAAVRIFDGRRDDDGFADPATDRTQLSEPLRLRNRDVDGPRVEGVFVTVDDEYDLFDPKPTDGPTPLVHSLTVAFTPTYDVDNNVDAEYEDIGGTGTLIGFDNDDDDATEIPIGFNFPFYGGMYTDVFVSTNGLLTFGGGVADGANQDLTSVAGLPFEPVIAPLWDNWDTDPIFSDGVYFETMGPFGDRRLIVQWRDIEHFDANGVGADPTVDFEVVLFEDGTIEFRYNDVITDVPTEDNGASATVGIREGTAEAGFGREVHQTSFNEAAIFDGRAVRFTPPFDPEIVTNVGHYSVVGDATGHALITSATFLAPNKVRLNFAEPLRDDRFTLVISDSLTDLAGNALDGESQAVAPGGYVLLPSGDGVAGGDFVARFTVDTRPEIGVWAAGTTLIDINGNFSFDPDNVDAVNRDLAFLLGFSSDSVFAGNFVDTLDAPGADADGFDKLAVYGRVVGGHRWLIDTDSDGVPDLLSKEPGSGVNGLPVAGEFDGDLTNGDEIGVFDGQRWYFDDDRSFTVHNNTAQSADYRGFPFVGDFDGDGDDDVGTYIASFSGGNVFSIDLNNAGLGSPISIDGNADYVFQVGIPGLASGGGFFGVPGVRERPVAADMNADGIDDIGLWVPDGAALVLGDQGEWFFLLSADNPDLQPLGNSVLGRIENGFVPFRPAPFGDDIYARFGNSFAVPIVGNFDPPLPGADSTANVVARNTLPETPVNEPEPAVDDGTELPADPELPTDAVVEEDVPVVPDVPDVLVVTEEPARVAFDEVASATYVESLYRNLLGRGADAAGRTRWLARIRDGATHEEVASAFWFSTERMRGIVEHHYRTYLGRSADAAGRTHWTGEMVAGMSEADLAVTFLTSNEFIRRHRNDAAYIEALYERVLGRSADRSGRDHWVGQLRRGVAREDIVRAMFTSREKQVRIIDAVYGRLLGRNADSTGLDLYLNQATSEMGKSYDVASMILASDEYFRRIRRV